MSGRGTGWYQEVFEDVWRSIQLVSILAWSRIFKAWILVPIGVLCILVLCWAVDLLIGLSSVSFPSSVALLILLLFSLICSQTFLGDKITKSIVRVVDVPTGFALKYINVFFTPSFGMFDQPVYRKCMLKWITLCLLAEVLLPLSPPVSGIEVGKIIAVFLVGYVLVFIVTVYFVRGLQIVFRTSKRAMTERAEEMGAEDDEIPLARRNQSGAAMDSIILTDIGLPEQPAPVQDSSAVRIISVSSPSEERNHEQPITALEVLSPAFPRHQPLPLTRPQRWAAMANSKLDTITYVSIFLFIGLPVYFSIDYAMPIQLSVSVLAYLTALAIPPKHKRILHPVLVCSAISILGIWVLALCHRQSLQSGLHAYTTGTKYQKLWSRTPNLPRPGAGDIFSSVLDVSIVALALPMFQYRNELKRHFFLIIIPNIAIAIASLFGYPALCYAIGMSSKRSLSFSARSLTLALANPTIANLGGDLNLVAVLCIMSGILGVLVGPTLLTWLRIPEDDYVTRGVTLGSNSSAIATALLLVSDPRAAALSSLSMGLFGTVTVALTSIPPVVRLVHNLVGLT